MVGGEAEGEEEEAAAEQRRHATEIREGGGSRATGEWSQGQQKVEMERAAAGQVTGCM